jgi:hypothetical protein
MKGNLHGHCKPHCFAGTSDPGTLARLLTLIRRRKKIRPGSATPFPLVKVIRFPARQSNLAIYSGDVTSSLVGGHRTK